MSRSVAWRRTITDGASWRQDQALNTTIFILREMGPTGFLLKEEGETKTFKVFIGDPHQCSCPAFRKEKDICKHICWVLLKKFRVPRQNPVTWQLGLVEREINEILRGIMVRQEQQPTAAARKMAAAAAATATAMLESGTADERNAGKVPQRDIAEDDVCPICQEQLLAKHQPVTYCRFSCGNNVHIKCMKVWADHQKTTGESSIKCPFCREDFGPLSTLQQEYRNSSVRETRAARTNEHLATTCNKCNASPIVGKCYKCVVCADYHLCQACFNTSTHTQHAFQFRQKPSQRWRAAPNREQIGGVLPPAMANQLMARDILEDDYDMLLQLDSQAAQQLSDLTEETIRCFPMERVRQKSSLLAPGEQCRICLRPYQQHQHVRRLPCRHKFHKDCIDNWLLHRHATCPVDGTIFTNESVQEWRASTQHRNTRVAVETQQGGHDGNGNHNNHRQASSIRPSHEIALEIPGIGLARMPGAAAPSNASNMSGSNVVANGDTHSAGTDHPRTGSRRRGDHSNRSALRRQGSGRLTVGEILGYATGSGPSNLGIHGNPVARQVPGSRGSISRSDSMDGIQLPNIDILMDNNPESSSLTGIEVRNGSHRVSSASSPGHPGSGAGRRTRPDREVASDGTHANPRDTPELVSVSSTDRDPYLLINPTDGATHANGQYRNPAANNVFTPEPVDPRSEATGIHTTNQDNPSGSASINSAARCHRRMLRRTSGERGRGIHVGSAGVGRRTGSGRAGLHNGNDVMEDFLDGAIASVAQLQRTDGPGTPEIEAMDPDRQSDPRAAHPQGHLENSTISGATRATPTATDLQPQPPSIPLCRHDNGLMLDVTHGRKPPASKGNTPGKLRSRLVYGDVGRSGRPDQRSRSRHNAISTEHRTQSDIFIGNDPTTSAGFTSEFMTSANIQRPLNGLRRGSNNARDPVANQSNGSHRWGQTETLTGDDMVLSGSAVRTMNLDGL